jgi:hypothetical protein
VTAARVSGPVFRVSGMSRRRRLIVGLVLLAVGVVLFGPWDGGLSECPDGPCEPGFLWKIWVAVAVVVLWLLAVAWFTVAWVRDRRRR